jgi:putative Mn2+ efflux pump MntP
MPLIGLFIGLKFVNLLHINPNLVVTIVLCFIGIQMIIECFKKNETFNLMSNTELLLFGLAVSIDSFSVGIGLNAISSNYLLCSLIFSVFSFCFTFLGLNIGKTLNKLIGHISVLLGGIILIVIGVIYLLKVF